MTRNQLFVAAAAAALMVSSVSTSSYAGLVKIKLLMTDGGAQSLTMVVPENCARTNWPSNVVSCEDVDAEYQPNDPAPTQFVRSPSGRLFRLAELRIDGSGYSSGGGTDRGHTDDIEQLGTTLGGGSSIGIATDEDGKVDLVLIDFKNDAAWKKFKSGEESGDLAATWTSVKARYGD